MGTFSAGGGRPPIDIINKYSDEASGKAITADTQKQILTGSLTADTYATILEITSGGGVLKSLAVVTKDATSRTLKPKVTIDGTNVFEQISSAIAASNTGVLIVGSTDDGDHLLDTGNMIWKTSLKIEVQSSLTETDKSALQISYYLT